MEMIIVYATFASEDQAREIAQSLLEKHLVACANILAGHQSIYRWQGKVEQATEVAAIFKTRHALFEAVENHIKSLHSYDVPCIVSWPITQGHGPFMQWLQSETANPEEIFS
jgi:periplasmic divalent cation tolerance protein